MIINPKNEDNECFKWAATVALEFKNIKSHPERVSNLNKFSEKYDWSGLEFPTPVKDIGLFEDRNKVSVNVLGMEDGEVYIHRKGRGASRAAPKIYLLLISENGVNHHKAAIKSLS